MRERDIFIEALQRDPAEQAAWLCANCGSDDELRHRVERLLAKHEGKESFFPDVPVTSRTARVDQQLFERPGTQIGPYRLVEQIGEGGMGTVFGPSRRSLSSARWR